MSELEPASIPAQPPAEPPSVIEVIERLLGGAPRVNLRDTAAADETPSSAAGVHETTLLRARTSYRGLREIARGGMGIVLRGRDNDLGRDVALKVLHKDLATRPEVVQRFVEAQIGGQLQHPGIVPVYELGLMADQRPYFAMKLIEGRTLSALLAQHEPGERRKLLEIFRDVCQTIAYAHSRGVVHRDLKPANVLIGAFGEVQVVDWGLAKVLRSDGESRANVAPVETVRTSSGSGSSHSLSGSVMGTPAYMSPEQARGEVERIDERSDVYALGAILCEMLTASRPTLSVRVKPLLR